MSGPCEGNDSPGRHIEMVDDNPSPRGDRDLGSPLRDSKGWDGKLRVPTSALLHNPEALSDPEYSDDDNVLQGEEVAADEGKAMADFRALILVGIGLLINSACRPP